MAPISPVETNVTQGSQQAESTREVQQEQRADREAASQSSEAAKRAVEKNPRIVVGSRNIEFSYNDEVDRVVVTVKSEDDEVVRQIPPEDYINFISRFRELIGVSLDEVI